jgi:phytoene synthase
MFVNTNMLQTDQENHASDEAFAYCAAITNAHYENFPVASLFLPEEKRPYIQAIYAFARIADDFADELKRPADDRLRDLNEWEEKLRLCYLDSAEHPVFVALNETVKRNNIPIEPLLNLLTAFKRDVTQNRYETFDDLLGYCSCSANPVGRLVLMIFGHRDERLFSLSDNICTALQLTNFWQDVAVDVQKDRLYIPIEDMARFGYPVEKWKTGVPDEDFRRLMKFQVDRTRQLFFQGAELPSLVEKELQLELKLVWFGGMSVLKRLEKIHYDVFHHRPVLKWNHKLQILSRAMLTGNLARPRKRKQAWDLT